MARLEAIEEFTRAAEDPNSLYAPAWTRLKKEADETAIELYGERLGGAYIAILAYDSGDNRRNFLRAVDRALVNGGGEQRVDALELLMNVARHEAKLGVLKVDAARGSDH